MLIRKNETLSGKSFGGLFDFFMALPIHESIDLAKITWFFSYVYQSTLVCQRGPVSKAYLVYSTLKTLDIMKGLFMAAPQYYCLEILNLCEVGMAQVHLANFWAARPTWKEKKKDKEASLFIGVSLAYPVAKKKKDTSSKRDECYP